MATRSCSVARTSPEPEPRSATTASGTTRIRGASRDAVGDPPANTGREEPRPGFDRLAAVAGRERLAILRLEQVDVAAACDVMGMAARALQRPAVALEKQSAVANRAGQWSGDHRRDPTL